MPPTDSKAIVLAGVSNEEREAAKEAIRAEKARATQEVRDVKTDMLDEGLHPKFLQNLSDSTKETMVATTASLTATQNALTISMKSGGKDGIDKKEIEKAITDGVSLCIRLVGASQMS